jgi:hypothetical protein
VEIKEKLHTSNIQWCRIRIPILKGKKRRTPKKNEPKARIKPN